MRLTEYGAPNHLNDPRSLRRGEGTRYNPRSVSPRPSDMPPDARPPLAAPTCPTEIAVELAGVSFGYDRRRPVLTGIDMAIPRGQVVAIMGASGSGKTTILRLIGGALRAQ